MWYNKHFHSLNYELKEHFGEKIIKLSIDGGFTCPNRDGSVGNKGCIFCNDTGSGDFAGSRSDSIKKQLEKQIENLKNKWPNAKYIAYFQNFTSTYDSIPNLKKKYEEALSCKNVIGLAIATRPDCLNQDILDLLSQLNKKTYLWIELGLQSIHEHSAKFIRRGYPLKTFDIAINNLNKYNIKTVSHIILNLPNENTKEVLQTINYLNSKSIWGIKIHMLHILKNTDLFDFYSTRPFKIMTEEEYVNLVVKCLQHLDPNITIHRMTGDGKKSELITPIWTLNKRSVLNNIDKTLRQKNLIQGDKYLNI